MPTGTGVLSKMGWKTISAWGEAWAAVDGLLPYTSETLTAEWQRIQHLGLIGQAGACASHKGPMLVRGEINFELDYYHFTGFLGKALGTNTDGTLTIDDNFASMFRLEIDKAVSRWRFDSCIINRLRISGRMNEAIKCNVEVFARYLTQDATAFPSLSLTSCSRTVLNDASYFRIANLTDALAAGDDTAISEFTFTLERNLTAPEWDTESPIYSIQPVVNGFRDVTLELELPRYAADTFATYKAADTALQAELYCTDSAEYFKLQLPEMKIVSGFDANVDGPGAIRPRGTLQCFRNVNNTPLTAITAEARIIIQSV